MFQFPGFAPSHDGTGSSIQWVAPFRHARIKSCLQIPEPFRSLPRLSSPPDSLGILRSLFVSFSLCEQILRRLTPPQDDNCHSERSEESNHCESHITVFALAYWNCSPQSITKKSVLVYRLNSIFCFTSNLFSQYCQWTWNSLFWNRLFTCSFHLGLQR